MISCRQVGDVTLISVITVVKNGEEHLKRCIESVQNQKDTNFEHIIIDGGSTDKTLDIIKKNSAKIDYWISEKGDKWIVYPWESEDSKEVQDYLV